MAVVALKGMDPDLTARDQRRDKIFGLRQSMMRELVTGRTRLV